MANKEVAMYSSVPSRSQKKESFLAPALLTTLIFGAPIFLLGGAFGLDFTLRVAIIPVLFIIGYIVGLWKISFPIFKKKLGQEIAQAPYSGYAHEVLSKLNLFSLFLKLPSRTKRVLISKYYTKTTKTSGQTSTHNHLKEIHATHELSHYLVVKNGKISFESSKEPTPHGLWDEALDSGSKLYNI